MLVKRSVSGAGILVLILLLFVGLFLLQQNTQRVFGASTRSYLLASGTVQIYPDRNPIYDLTPFATTSQEVDLINVAVEFWGIPWEMFAAGQTPADDWEWTQKMRAIASDANSTGKAISLS